MRTPTGRPGIVFAEGGVLGADDSGSETISSSFIGSRSNRCPTSWANRKNRVSGLWETSRSSSAHRNGTSSVESRSGIVWFNLVEDFICHTPRHRASGGPFPLEEFQQKLGCPEMNHVNRQSVMIVRPHENSWPVQHRWLDG